MPIPKVQRNSEHTMCFLAGYLQRKARKLIQDVNEICGRLATKQDGVTNVKTGSSMTV
jgi:hypothetical protein